MSDVPRETSHDVISGRVRFHAKLTDLLVDITLVSAHPQNPRNGDVDAIAESIEINGFISPVIVQKSTGYIIAGNHRYYALLQLGSALIPVIYIDVTDIEADRYLLADNRTSDLGIYDQRQLVNILEGILKDSEGDLAALRGTGYNARDLEVLTALTEIENETLDFAQWPTMTFQVPPHVKTGFLKMTKEAETDSDRFELMMRLAGWDGKK